MIEERLAYATPSCSGINAKPRQPDSCIEIFPVAIQTGCAENEITFIDVDIERHQVFDPGKEHEQAVGESLRTPDGDETESLDR
jgi:hypothetical protein